MKPQHLWDFYSKLDLRVPVYFLSLNGIRYVHNECSCDVMLNPYKHTDKHNMAFNTNTPRLFGEEMSNNGISTKQFH